MVPPAPPTFSTITGWPSDFRICSATMRARMSEPPPAGNGTIMVTGFDGKPCACAWTCAAAADASAAPNASANHGRFIRSVHFDAVRLDDRPPLVSLGLVVVVQCLRRQLRL